MSLWSKLFGERETAAQKIARAQAHLDEHEPTLAARIVANLDGPEVDEIRRRAREMVDAMDARAAERPPVSIEPDRDDPLHADNQPPEAKRAKGGARGQAGRGPGDPYREPARRAKQQGRAAMPAAGDLVLQFNADGSTTISSGPDVLTLNAPVSDDDGRPRSTDALDVARRLITSTANEPIDHRAFAFVEAVLVLVRAGEPLPRLTDPSRAAAAELVRAAHQRDPEAIVAMLRAATPEVASYLAVFAPPLAIGFAARELGVLVLEDRVTPTWTLADALVRIDPDLCARVAAHVSDPLFAGTTLLLAEATGVALPALEPRWIDWTTATEHRDAWRALAIRRLARRDLDAALALAEEHAADCGPDHAADVELATQLAKLDPARAIATAFARDPHVDHAGWLAGLARARVPRTHELVDTWLDELGPHTYDPYAFFAELLAACIALDDVDRTRRCIAKAGPTGWQIACAAHHGIARAAAREALLAACYERVPAGVVAGCAIAFGALPLGAGKMVLQPAWLAFTDPHPIETLALPVALGADAPAWP